MHWIKHLLFKCNLKVTYLPMLCNSQSEFGWQVDGKKWLFSMKILYIYWNLLPLIALSWFLSLNCFISYPFCWKTILQLASSGDISLRSCQPSTMPIKSIVLQVIALSWKNVVHITSIESDKPRFTLTAAMKFLLPPKDLPCHPRVYCFRQISWSNRNYRLEQ